jgi:hypothetical protein
MIFPMPTMPGAFGHFHTRPLGLRRRRDIRISHLVNSLRRLPESGE